MGYKGNFTEKAALIEEAQLRNIILTKYTYYQLAFKKQNKSILKIIHYTVVLGRRSWTRILTTLGNEINIRWKIFIGSEAWLRCGLHLIFLEQFLEETVNQSQKNLRQCCINCFIFSYSRCSCWIFLVTMTFNLKHHFNSLNWNSVNFIG